MGRAEDVAAQEEGAAEVPGIDGAVGLGVDIVLRVIDKIAAYEEAKRGGQAAAPAGEAVAKEPAAADANAAADVPEAAADDMEFVEAEIENEE